MVFWALWLPLVMDTVRSLDFDARVLLSYVWLCYEPSCFVDCVGLI